MVIKIKASFAIFAVISIAFGTSQAPVPTAESSYIIQGSSLEVVVSAVLAVDGEITHELGIINAVAAALTVSEREALEERGDLDISGDNAVDINADLPGNLHYGGRANVDENGNYYIMDLEGYLWTNGCLWANGFVGAPTTESMSINNWVEQE
jgi:hypothetical protein